MAQTLSTATKILPETLIAAGYREYPPTVVDKFVTRCFQKAICDPDGQRRRYFINFREYPGTAGLPVSYNALVCCETETGGYAWITLKEDTIEQTEARSEACWKALGGCYYD